MTNEEMDELFSKIDETDPSEQLLLAAKLIEELTVNNKFFDEFEYDIEKSEKYIDEMETLSKKIRAKIEIKKINNLVKRFNKLKKVEQKTVLDDISKIISKVEDKMSIEYCYDEQHSFTNWEQQYNIILKTKKEDNGERKLVEIKIPYWSRKCNECGYEEKSEKEPSHLVQKRNEQMIKKRIKILKEEIEFLEENL